MKVTQWFEPEEKPIHIGFYDTQYMSMMDFPIDSRWENGLDGIGLGRLGAGRMGGQSSTKITVGAG